MEEEPLDESIQLKTSKKRSQAQIAAFEKAQQKRLENAKLKKDAIDKAKKEIEEDIIAEQNKNAPTPVKQKKPKKEKDLIEPHTAEQEEVLPPKPKPKPPKKEPKVIYQDASESEEETIIVKKKKKKQPKIVYEDATDSEGDLEEVKPPPKPKAKKEPIVKEVKESQIIKTGFIKFF